MEIFSILQAPNPILLTKAKPIKRITPELVEFIQNMEHTMRKQDEPKAVGLAAPQVGKSVQLFLLHDKENEPCQVFINPRITLLKAHADDVPPIMLEGCLSLKNLWGAVQRKTRLRVRYRNEKGRTCSAIFTGFAAQIIQHEYDHLQGILFPQRVTTSEFYRYAAKTNMFYSFCSADDAVARLTT